MHNYLWLVLIPLAAGFLYGRYRDKHARRAGLKLGLAVLAVMGAPVLILMAAKLFGSDVLGWMFALSLFVEIPLLLLLGTGFAAGSFFNRPWCGKPVKPGDYPPAAIECSHLQPLKLAMQSGNIEMQPENLVHTRANCRINLKEVARRFGPAIAALYEERHFIDRSFHDPKSAYFWCDACRSRLSVVHPEEARAATPWFPLPGDKPRGERATSAACSW